jgi:uncharacterized protein YbjT (DUF2867 family)
MKLLVIGSTGRTGRHLLDQALERGYDVTAFTRKPATLTDRAGLSAVIGGDATDPHVLLNALHEQDAVVAIIGASSRKGPHQAAQVARVLTAAMAEQNVRRLVITSAYPIVATQPRIPIAILKAILRAAYTDHRAMEQIVTDTELDYTIARLNRLTDQPARGQLRITQQLITRPSALPRADAAAALLNILEDPTLDRTAVNIASASRAR